MTTGGVVRCRQRTLCRRRIRGRRAGMPRRTRRRRPARRRTRAGIGRRGQRHCRGICDRHPHSQRDRQRPHATDVLCVFHGWFPFAHPHRINGAVVINKGVAEWSVARCTTVHIGIGNRRRPGARRPHGPRCRVPQRSRVASRRCGRCIAVAEPRSNFDVEPIPTLFTGNPVRGSNPSAIGTPNTSVLQVKADTRFRRQLAWRRALRRQIHGFQALLLTTVANPCR